MMSEKELEALDRVVRLLLSLIGSVAYLFFVAAVFANTLNIRLY